jgi:hypothetical protein
MQGEAEQSKLSHAYFHTTKFLQKCHLHLFVEDDLILELKPKFWNDSVNMCV